MQVRAIAAAKATGWDTAALRRKKVNEQDVEPILRK
jgi:hypothetical protein